ncbi:MAG: GTP cyclohydrolase I FolE2, partial [Acidobacteriota bacterium]|nr:GTP cyclohydrolase I FolE2 [Acidobacteriota bacterium]
MPSSSATSLGASSAPIRVRPWTLTFDPSPSVVSLSPEVIADSRTARLAGAVSAPPTAATLHSQPDGTATAGPISEDVQARPPSVPVGLSRVGVTGVEKVIRVRQELYFARLDCFVDLGSDQKGAHMSRFEEVVNEAIGEVVLGEAPFRAETLATHIAELVRERQGAERAEVR